MQITIVTSLLDRCRFVESLKDIMLNIFIENERIRRCICISVEQQYLCIFPVFFLFFFLFFCFFCFCFLFNSF